MKLPLTINGRDFRVGIVYDSMIRSFEKVEGPNAGDMMSGRHESDLLGTRFPYQLAVEPDPAYPGDYDDLYELVTDPDVDVYTVKVPYGQGYITYDAQILSGTDQWKGVFNGHQRWTGLTLSYRPVRLRKVRS